MEVYTLGNQTSPPQSSSSPIIVPAYQADQAVIQLANGTIPSEIGGSSGSTTLQINEYVVDIFQISNGITNSITLPLAVSQILSLTINGIEYYQNIDWTLGLNNQTITFTSYIPYQSTYGNSIVKVVYEEYITGIISGGLGVGNIDGGKSNSVYLLTQIIDGGNS